MTWSINATGGGHSFIIAPRTDLFKPLAIADNMFLFAIDADHDGKMEIDTTQPFNSLPVEVWLRYQGGSYFGAIFDQGGYTQGQAYSVGPTPWLNHTLTVSSGTATLSFPAF